METPVKTAASAEEMLKEEAIHLEEGLKSSAVDSSGENDDTEQALVRQVLWKIDRRLIPILGGLYLWCLIDRSNLGGARIAGIDEAVGLNVGNRASIVILVFYLGYILFELPSNIVLQKVGPAIWLSALASCWGIGLFPGTVYLLSSWYCRYEYQKRIAVYYIIGNFFSSFANILAYGLTQVADNPAHNGWKYIFIVEGALTAGYAVLCWRIIPDMPYNDQKNKWLTPAEKALVKQRLLADINSFETEKITWNLIFETLRKPYMWAL
ncbi:hypothetical protein LTR84_009134 [Exophiala bonariae]|uniref:Major facilitator superfamily (MFS) profile domain-containing protein n=1 Tax=Exophiala bonariae TaxID=1690606 RepID=A0AAV9MV24_9EURO|nr:hypothetical protein LTR84_009134 [Exophiala bonariae]